MKKMTLTSAAIVGALSLGGTAAMAADHSWAGAYGGLSVGYQDGQLTGRNGGTLDYYGISNPDPGSPTGGAFAGYNYQIPQSPLVAGVEASFTIGGEKQSKQGSAFPFANPEATVSVPYMAALKARLGYAAGQFLPYAQAGVVEGEARFKVTADDGTALGGSRLSAGWLVGAGVDYALQNNLFLRASYSYTRLANMDYLKTAGEFDHRLALNDFQAGFGYKF